MSEHAPGRAQRWRYWVMLVLLLLGQGTSAIPSPLYSLYAEKWHYAPVLTTVIFGSYGAMALVAILLTGPLSDRFGRRPLLIAALILVLIGLGVFLIASGPGDLVIARMLHGLGVGILVVAAGAGVIDVSPHTSSRNGTLSAVFLNLGIAIFAIGTATLAQTGFDPLSLPYIVDAVLAILLLLCVLGMRETHQPAEVTPLRITRPGVPRDERREFLFAATGASAAWAVLGVCFSLEPAIASQAAHVSGHLFGGVLIATLAMTAAVAQIVTATLPAYKVAITGNIALGMTTLAAIGAMTTGNPVLIVCVVGLQSIFPAFCIVAAVLCFATVAIGLRLKGSR